MSDFQEWARHVAGVTEQTLAELLPPAGSNPQRLHDAMRYSTLGGGKRVRPMLAFAAGLVTNADIERVKIVSSAVEMIHAYSLIHDDLPCMDNDVLRRGRPTCHIEFDEATALLAGDALQALAFELVSTHKLADASAVQLEMIQLFTRACGSHGMAGGQAIDLANVGLAQSITLPELEFMHMQKTGALIRAAVMLGARCGAGRGKAGGTIGGKEVEPDTLAHLDSYAKCVGLAFQVVDDVLDCESNTEKLGKTVGKDQDANKPTYVSLMGLNPAKQFANELLNDALGALNSFDQRADRLRQLAEFIVRREH